VTPSRVPSGTLSGAPRTPTAALVVIVQGGCPPLGSGPATEPRFLLLLRGKTAPWAPGRWGLPGGSLQPAETPHAAALREMGEEIGSSGPRALWYAGQIRSWAVYLTYDNGQDIVFTDNEHDAFAWVTVGELPHFPLAPGVTACLALALRKYHND
jgi:8-oxo-dGTP pyrophosphatase MutT (NUDIX family)